MRELLVAFVFALIVGSIINGMQQKPSTPAPVGSTPSAAPSSAGNNNAAENNRRDFPDFASFTSVDNTNFEQTVLKAEKPVFIECYVPNSPACDQMIPLVAAVGKGHEDAIVMAKMNVMDNIVLAHRYEISNVPAFLLFSRGELIGKLSGVLPQDRLESMIANLPNGEH